MSETFSIKNTTKSTLPRVPFDKIKKTVVGNKYTLSLVFIGQNKSKELNFRFRKKNKPTNVLSFSLSENQGEIFITPFVVKKQLKIFNKKYEDLTAYLFIHGLLHLKGHEHGSTMEEAEKKLCKKFSV